MNIDREYPDLSKLARSAGGTTLADLAESDNSGGKFLDLRGACHYVVLGCPRHGGVVADQWSYLATLDLFLKRFSDQEAPRKAIWRKINVAGKSSEFLDTICEAALALQLRKTGLPVQLEVPFDSTSKTSKNADIIATLSNGNNIWLDAFSIQPEGDMFVSHHPFPTRSRADVITLLAKRISAKYDSKFRDAVENAHVGSVGLLLCLLKCEEMIATFMPELLVGSRLPEAPSYLWNDCPSLNCIYIHTLERREGADLLAPVQILWWNRPDFIIPISQGMEDRQ